MIDPKILAAICDVAPEQAQIWLDKNPDACELWFVSKDKRLVVFRNGEGSGASADVCTFREEILASQVTAEQDLATVVGILKQHCAEVLEEHAGSYWLAMEDGWEGFETEISQAEYVTLQRLLEEVEQ